MSRLSRDRVCVGLTPHAISWIWLSGAFASRIVAKRSVDFDCPLSGERWAGAAMALSGEARAWHTEPIDVIVILSNDFVRYVVVPPAASASGPEDDLALARFHFSRVYGTAAGSWDVRLSPGPGRERRLACAVDSALVRAIRSCFPEESRARLTSVQPFLMAVFNRARGMIPKLGAWLLVAEPGRSCLALWCANAWQAVANTRGEHSDPNAWHRLLDCERLRSGVAAVSQTVLVYGAPQRFPLRGAAGEWQSQDLGVPTVPGLLPEESERYGMALAGR